MTAPAQLARARIAELVRGAFVDDDVAELHRLRALYPAEWTAVRAEITDAALAMRMVSIQAESASPLFRGDR